MKQWLCLAAMLMTTVPASGQVIFFDDFNGSTLAPRWIQPPASQWQYNVSNSMLNVTALLYPGQPPKTPTNFTGTGTVFGATADYRITSRMGWDAGTGQGLSIVIVGSAGGILAEFGYRAWGPYSPSIFAQTAGSAAIVLSAPPVGLHDFVIERSGNVHTFFLDGSFVTQLSGLSDLVGGLSLRFYGPAADPLGPLHVDRIEVLPAPGVAAVFVFSCGFFGTNRRRRACPDIGNYQGSSSARRSSVPMQSSPST